jgi:glutaredoxin
MRRLFGIIAVVFVLVLRLSSAAAVTVRYFDMNLCELCDTLAEFADSFHRLTNRDLSEFEYQYYNVYTDEGMQAYREATQSLNGEEKKLPLLIWGDNIYAGTQAIEDGLATLLPNDTEDDTSVLYFLITDTCDNCEDAKNTVKALPESVRIYDGIRLLTSSVEVIEINIVEEPEKALQIFKYYQIADKDRTVPAIFFGKTYLLGKEQINGKLISALQNGEALGTPVFEAEPAGVSEPIQVGSAIIAGLAAGFNPCALSMLILFAGTLVTMRKNLLLLGGVFLVAKGITYLLIGFAFSALWEQQFFGSVNIAQIVTTVIAVIVIVLNLLDVHHLHGQEYGKLRNQLPKVMRGGLRKVIGTIVAHSGIGLVVCVFSVGIIVACGEFLCAGQLYVALLISHSHSEPLALVVYCAAFLLPSVVVLSLVWKSRETFGSSDWMLRHMSAIKVLTSVVMACILAYTWLT